MLSLVIKVNSVFRYGVNQVRFIKHIQQICLLLRDKDSRIQELGLNALVEIYQEIREDLLQVLPKCNMSAQKRIQLEASFKMADAKKWSGYLVAVSEPAVRVSECKSSFVSFCHVKPSKHSLLLES